MYVIVVKMVSGLKYIVSCRQKLPVSLQQK